MRRNFHSLCLTLSLLGASAPTIAHAQLAPPRRPFLFKDDRGDVAAARASGERAVTVLIAAMPGKTADLVRLVSSMGGTIRFRHDNVDYLRARVPTDSVERLAHDALVHSLDVNVKGSGRTFATEPSGATPDEQRPLGPETRARVAADTTRRAWPPTGSDHPLTSRYDPLGDMGAAAWRKAHPTWDGRGVTLAMIDMNPDPFEPELQSARTLDGKPIAKIAFYETVIDQIDEDEGRWLSMKDEVTATGGSLTWGGKSYGAPRSGTFRIASLNEAAFDSLSASGLEKDLNRDGNPAGSSRLFAVLWDRKSNDVWVDTNQNLSFADEKALTNYRQRPGFGTFGTDNPKTPVRESVGFGVQIDSAKEMVSINAGVPFHASLVVGAALGSRGARGRYDGVAPGARLASVAEGCQAYGQTEAVIVAMENPAVDGAWLEQCSGMTRPYLLRDGRLVPTVIYSRLIEKYKKPLMIPTHNYPVLGASDDFVLADCGIGVGGHEGKENFLHNYGVRTKYDDNLLITGGYGPMGNGAFGPTIISPSNIMAGYRGWEHPASAYMASVYLTPPGYLIAGGTSTATPTASGAVALLISAARQSGVKFDACTLKEAIASSARYVPNLPAYKQGNGVINVAGAWELLKALDTSKTRVTIASRAPVKHAYSALLDTPNEGVSLFEREGWSAGDRGSRTITFTRTTGPTEPMAFALSFTGDSGTFSAPTTITLPLGQAVPVTLDVAPKKTGVHSALLTLDNPKVPGHAYRLLTTVVAAEPLNAGNHFTVVTKTEVPRPEMRSFFYRVPEGANALQVVLDAPKRAVQLAMIAPDTRSATVTQVVSSRGRGEGGGGGPEANRPPETFVTRNPMPGVWEVRLTDIADTKDFDWRASAKGGPVPPTAATITVSAVSVGVDAPTVG
ncbi:MAG: S8 family serine peptidase, partial [Gemmatimonadaceae bacterium]